MLAMVNGVLKWAWNLVMIFGLCCAVLVLCVAMWLVDDGKGYDDEAEYY